MQALIVIDAQNEFSPAGQRPVPDHQTAIDHILRHVREARDKNRPIAWVRHFNKPTESPAFVPGSWGSGFFAGIDPKPDTDGEAVFEKNVYGAFTGSNLGEWLSARAVNTVLLAGFYTHGCVATTAREAIMRDLLVLVDPNATRACAITHATLGHQSEEDVRRSALLHLFNMGASILV